MDMDRNDLKNKEEMEYELVSLHTVQEKKTSLFARCFLDLYAASSISFFCGGRKVKQCVSF